MSTGQSAGRLAIVLHSHMPYVEGFGDWPFGEEWLWRAVAESYLRVADVIEGKPVTLGVTPVLADQFEDLREARRRPLDRLLRRLARVLLRRGHALVSPGRPRRSLDLAGAAARGLPLGEPRASRANSIEIWRRCSIDSARSGVELLGGPATHCIVPLLATDLGADLQFRVGRESHARRFGPIARRLAAGVRVRRTASTGCLRGQASSTSASTSRGPRRRLRSTIFNPSRPRPDRSPSRSTGRRSSWSGTRTATPRPTPIAPASTARSMRCFRATTSATRGIHRSRTRPGACSRGSVPAQRRRAARDPRDRALTAMAASAWSRSTPSCSVTGGTRARGGSRRCSSTPRRPASSWSRSAMACARSSRSSDRSRGRAGARSKTLETWDSPAVAEFAWQQRAAELAFGCLASIGSRRRRTAALRAARELLALQSSDWAFLETREQRRRVRRPALRRAPGGLRTREEPLDGPIGGFCATINRFQGRAFAHGSARRAGTGSHR